MVKGQHYKIIVVAGTQGLDPLRDNVDVEVVFDDGSRFVATFFTLENVQMIMDGYRQTGECSKGLYFWASDMILVADLPGKTSQKSSVTLLERANSRKPFLKFPRLCWNNRFSHPAYEHFFCRQRGPDPMDRSPTNPPTARRMTPMVQAIGVRVLFYGGTLLLALFYFIDLRTLLGLRPAGAGADARPASATESPGGWPNLRGPDYSGVSRESDLADSWPPEGPPVLWTEEIGRGYSALAAAGKRVYTLGQTMTEQYVVAMDADTGRRIWEHRCGWPFDPAGMYPGPRATPTWREGASTSPRPTGWSNASTTPPAGPSGPST